MTSKNNNKEELTLPGNIQSQPNSQSVQGEAYEAPPEPCNGRPNDNNSLTIKEAVSSYTTRYVFREAAIRWFEFGLQVIPIVPGTKRTAVKWDPWLDNLSQETIDNHWEQHPDHEVGFITSDDLFVVDTDSPEAVAAFNQLMESFGISCNHIVSTSKGEHYYFQLTPGTFAKQGSHDTQEHPARLDIKTGRSMVVVPPSTGKAVSISEAESTDDFVEISQDFIDAVSRHNGRDEPRRVEPRERTLTEPSVARVRADEITTLLEHIDPDSGYADWIAVGMAIHHALDGEDAGLVLFDGWSSKGTKYPGRADLEKKWASFDGHTGTPVTLGTIRKLVVDSGIDLEDLFEEFFDPIEDIHGVADVVAQIIAQAQADTDTDTDTEEHDLLKYSMQGMSAQLEADMLQQVFILGMLVILGQWAVIYAPPNTGKTLIVLWLIIEGIKNGAIDPDLMFYINADDNQAGLTEKLKLVEEYGFHMIVPGYQGFHTKDFLKLLRGLTANGQARGTIIIVDTLKKFTDLMDKRTASDFGNVTREFTATGGTLIALAHVNKKRDSEGKPIYAGTSDIVDDSDCAYVMDTLSNEKDVCTVEFENIKNRGMAASRAAYQYSSAEGLDYYDLLESVTLVDDTRAGVLRQAVSQRDDNDAPLIQAIVDCINESVTAKTKIIEMASAVTGDSKRHAGRVLEKHTGTDPNLHHWNFTIGDRGVNTFELLPTPDDEVDMEEL